MKRKLLDAALVVFGATGITRLLLNSNVHVPHDFQRSVNAVMLLSAALSISLLLSILIQHVRMSRIRPLLPKARTVTAAVIISVLVMFCAYLLTEVAKPTTQSPQVTWDDQKK